MNSALGKLLSKFKVSQNSSHQVSQFEILQGLIDQGSYVSPESSGGLPLNKIRPGPVAVL